MISIIKADPSHFKVIANLGKQTFLESHGSSAKQKDLDLYTSRVYSEDAVLNELENINFHYHIMNYDYQPVGYSKIIFNSCHPKVSTPNITKLERIYITKEFYDHKLGKQLFDFIINFSKMNNQSGIWLNVWVENQRAIKYPVR